MKVKLMPFPLPTRLSQPLTSTFIRSNSSHELAHTKSNRPLLSSSATVTGDDWLGFWNAVLRAAWHRYLLLIAPSQDC